MTSEPDAKPAPGPTVSLAEQGPAIPPGLPVPVDSPACKSSVRFAETDEDGRYAFRVGPGTHLPQRPRCKVEPGRQDISDRRRDRFERNFRCPRDRPWDTVRGTCGPESRRAADRRAFVRRPIELNCRDAHGDAHDRGRFEVPARPGKPCLRPQPGGRSRRLHGGRTRMIGNSRSSPGRRRPPAVGSSMRTASPGAWLRSMSPMWWLPSRAGRGARMRPPGGADRRRRPVHRPGLPVGTNCYFYANSPGANQPRPPHGRERCQPFEIPPLVIDRPRPRPPVPR